MCGRTRFHISVPDSTQSGVFGFGASGLDTVKGVSTDGRLPSSGATSHRGPGRESASSTWSETS